MRKTIVIIGVCLVIIAAGFFIFWPVFIDIGIRSQARRIGERFRHDLLNDGRLHVITVGTGSPNANPRRVQSCLAIIVDGVFILIDTGAGSAQQADLMGLPLSDLNAVFLTHLHSDHMADLPLVASKGWRFGRRTRLDVFGPVGTINTINGLNEGHRLDREYRYQNNKDNFAPLEIAEPIGHDIETPGPAEKKLVMSYTNGLSVFAFTVEHAPVEPAFGFRVEYKERSVVISGDTRRCENIARQASGADLLIHEAFNKNLVRRMVAVFSDSKNKSMLSMKKMAVQVQKYHTSPVEAAEMAARANVKKLVFTHIDPPLGPFLVRRLVTQPFFMKGVSDVFKGEVVIAEDGTHFRL